MVFTWAIKQLYGSPLSTSGYSSYDIDLGPKVVIWEPLKYIPYSHMDPFSGEHDPKPLTSFVNTGVTNGRAFC